MTIQTGDIRLIKNINHRIILNLIRREGIVSGARLAQITGMRPSTISNLLKEFLSKDLIISRGKGQSTERGGKKPNLWSLNKDTAFSIGIDLEMGTVSAVVLNLMGETAVSREYSANILDNGRTLLRSLREIINEISEAAGISDKKTLGLGIALPAVVDAAEGNIITSRILPSPEFPPLRQLQDSFEFPVIVENNANAAAIGEKWVGAAGEISNFITVLIEIDRLVGGLGLGLVLNGDLIHGATFSAGELNISIPKMRDTLASLSRHFPKGKILKSYQNRIGEIDIRVMIDAALNGDDVAQSYFSMLGHLIGKTIASSVGLINPERIILSGDVAELGEILIRPVQESIQMETLWVTNQRLETVPSSHGRFSVAIGSACLILNDYFKPPVSFNKNIVKM